MSGETEYLETLADQMPPDITATYSRARTLPTMPGPSDRPTESPSESARLTIVLPGRGGDAQAAPVQPGGYRMLRVLGAGGMGEVWEAEQRSLHRIVAVKRLNPRREAAHRDSEGAMGFLKEEFRREALIAARLEHPNIVPVHERGVDENGSPLLAMKLVQGRPWSDILAEDFEALDPAEYLRRHLAILGQMAQAVAFAHSRGIVHRDLKPSQVMVGDFGEVMLMDWGLAFFMGSDTPDRDWAYKSGITTVETASNPSGTAAFMAPEQTLDGSHKLGPWTDVYLLGATLYFVLTGTCPHRAASSLRALERAASGIVEPPHLRAPQRRIAAELEAICLKAMAADPRERFPSAQAFHAALENYISGASRQAECRALLHAVGETLAGLREYQAFGDALAQVARARQLWPDNPEADHLEGRVLAAYAERAVAAEDLGLAAILAERIAEPESRRRLKQEIAARETARAERERQRLRLRKAVAATGLAALLAAGGFAAYLAYSRKAIREERNRAVAAEAVAKEGRQKAEEARREAEGMMSYMVVDLTEKLKPLGRLDVLEDACNQVAEFLARRASGDRSVEEREVRINLLMRIGQIRREQGKSAEAETVVRQALDEAEKLVAHRPADPAALEKVINAANALSMVLAEAGKLGEARAAIERAIATRERAAVPGAASAENDIALALDWKQLGSIFESTGQLADAEAAFAKSRELGERAVQRSPQDIEIKRKLAMSIFEGVATLRHLGKTAEALAHAERALSLTRDVAAAHPDDANRQRDLAVALHTVADILRQQGEKSRAAEYRAENLAISERLAASDPANATWQRDLAMALDARGGELRDNESLDEAVPVFEKAAAILERLADDNRGNPGTRVELAIAYQRIGQLHEARKDLDAAAAAYTRMLELLEATARDAPEDMRTQRGLVVGWLNLGKVRNQQRRPADAREAYERSLSVANRLVDSEPSNVRWRRDRCIALIHIGEVRADAREHAEARAAFEEAVDGLQSISAAQPAERGLREEAAAVWYRLGNLARDEGNLDAALDAYSKCIAAREALYAESPGTPAQQRDLAAVHLRAASALEAQRNLAKALAAAERAVEVLVALADADPAIIRNQSELAGAHRNAARILLELGRADAAREAAQRAIALREHCVRTEPGTALYGISLGADNLRLGRIEEAIGGPDAARSAYAKACSLLADAKEDDGSLSVETRALLARARARIGDSDAARSTASALLTETRLYELVGGGRRDFEELCTELGLPTPLPPPAPTPKS